MTAIALPLDEGGTVPIMVCDPPNELLVIVAVEADIDAPENAPPAAGDPA